MQAKLRIKCPHCRRAANVRPDVKVCPECHKPIALCPEACIYLYRMGSFFGVASGFSIYINGEDYGSIGNRELLCIPVPYGSYNLHCAAGINRRCDDLVVTLTPQCRVGYTKVHIRPGAWTSSFEIEPMDPRDLQD